MKTRLGDLAEVLRSKNAGPFLVTVDIMFKDLSDFERVQHSRVLEPGNVAKVYGVTPEQVKGPFFHEAALGAKVTVPKLSSAQDPFCRDLLGCSQHMPIADLEL
jgi:hypothetical protein